MADQRGRWLWIFSALVPITATALVAVLTRADDPIEWMGAVAVAFAMASLVQVPSAGRSRFTAGYLVVAAVPFISTGSGRLFTVREIVAALAAGSALMWIIQAAKSEDQGTVLTGFVKRSLAYAAFIGMFAVGENVLAFDTIPGWHDALLFVAAASAAFVAEVLTTAVFRAGVPGSRPRLYLVLDTARDLNVYISLVAAGALFGIAFETIGWWALALAALPYAFAHGAFRRYVDARQTYAQTMRSLARIPEVAGHSDPGHAARTAELAVGVAAELGLRPRDVDTVEYAALLHDIGRISLNEPSVLRMGFTDGDIAKWGSEIVGETSYLAEVSDVVLRQHEPYRNPGVESNQDVPMAAKIVKVCSAYDESTHELGFSPLESMEKLHRGSVYDYDPEVVAVLRRLLERRGEFDRPLTRR
ncbi:MAG TPA: HD domain-containing phosphohydrolase [Acidimicrobiia bacterium]|nr:HD domain-containing phosphohydrolase [Acidimicrobiia bacterium]